MNINRPNKDLIEIFGHSPDDLTLSARSLWNLGACPFTHEPCTKKNHDSSIVYGTCTVTANANGQTCIICPNRLYADKYAALRKVAGEAFGTDIEFLMFGQYVARRTEKKKFVVALGHNSGKEVKIEKSMSMDWVLALVNGDKLEGYVGIEVQSIDITGNYRDSWYAYKNLKKGNATVDIPKSAHGLNWANVHKRLMPQIIRKGLIYSRSKYVTHGLYFIVPDIVYQKFEDIIGSDIATEIDDSPSTITIHTYQVSESPPHGEMRKLEIVRQHKISLEEFSSRFINGPNLPSGDDLDSAVKSVLRVS